MDRCPDWMAPLSNITRKTNKNRIGVYGINCHSIFIVHTAQDIINMGWFCASSRNLMSAFTHLLCEICSHFTNISYYFAGFSNLLSISKNIFCHFICRKFYSSNIYIEYANQNWCWNVCSILHGSFRKWNRLVRVALIGDFVNLLA